jgi:hypothetical protein
MPYLKSPPRPSIHVKRPLYTFTRYTTSDFLTLYFPILECTEQFQVAVEERIKAFSGLALPSYGNPEDLICMESGWVEEVQRINGIEWRGFIICMTWYNRETEKNFKEENAQWAMLMEDINSMGGIRQEEYHGEVLRIPKEKREHEERGRDESEQESALPKNVSLPARLLTAILNNRRGYTEAGEKASNVGPIYATDLVRARSTLRRTNHALFERPPVIKLWRVVPSIKDDICNPELDHSEHESSEGSPLLTPSSSCMSLGSFYYKDTFCTDCRQPRFDSDAESGEETLDDDRTAREATLDACVANNKSISTRGPGSSRDWHNDDGDLASASGLEPTTELKPHPAAASSPNLLNPLHKKLINSLPSSQISEGPALSDCGHRVAETMCRNPGARWDPDEEVEIAKERFSKYRKTATALRLQGQRIKSTPPPPPARRSRMQTERKDAAPWKTFFKGLLPNPSTASSAETSPAVVYGAKYIHGQKVSEYHVAELDEKSYKVPGSFRDSPVAEVDV